MRMGIDIKPSFLTFVRSAGQKNWFRPLKNAGIVGAGKGAQGVISLIAMALAARHLGVETFGFFVLIHGMVFGASQIFRFQTWQAVLRYGAAALNHNDKDRLQHLTRFTFTLDVLSAVAGTILMVAIAGPLSRVFSLPEDQIWMAQLYAISIAFMLLTPTQLGVLRLFDRFDLVAIQTIIGPAFRFIGTLILFFGYPEAGLFAYLSIWFIGGLVARQAMFIMAGREMKRHGFDSRSFLPVNPFKPREEKIWGFVMGHNIFRSFYIAHEQIALVMIGALLGPAAAGIFRIAQKFAAIMIKPAEKFLVPALYPELARFEASSDKTGRRQMIVANLAIVGGVSLVLFTGLALAGQWLIIALTGEDYAAAYIPMIWLCGAGLIKILSYPLEPLLSAAGRVKALIGAYGAGLVLYIGALYGLMQIFGLPGAAMAALAAEALSALIMFLFHKKRHD